MFIEMCRNCKYYKSDCDLMWIDTERELGDCLHKNWDEWRNKGYGVMANDGGCDKWEAK